MSLLHFNCLHRYPTEFELDLAFDMQEGVTALFGPSGSGKSTTLALIAGLLRPSRGWIRLADRVLLDTTAGVHVRPEMRGVGFIHQEHLLFPHLTVEKNLRYGMQRRPRRQLEMRDVVAILELAEVLNRYPHSLSGGQRQRVAIARTILRGPDLLLMDEPLSSLDDPLKDRILAYLEQVIAEFRIPTLLVTHDAAVADRLAVEVVHIHDGKRCGNDDDSKGRETRAARHPLPIARDCD